MAKKDIGFIPLFQRVQNAHDSFALTLQGIVPMTDTEARAITAYYIKQKLAKVDAAISTINVIRGVFLDKPVVKKALEIVREDNAI